MPYDLGIDLGTTYTCAAVARDGHVELVQLGHASPLIPSVVSIREGGEVLIGDTAERRSLTDPTRTVHEFKRRLGDETPYVIGGLAYAPEALTGELLRGVVAQVAQGEGGDPRRVALTHPANYGPFKLGKLRGAADLAHLTNPLLVPEPVAAAVVYGKHAKVDQGAHILVYDLGGGTLDVAVVRIGPDGAEVVGTPDGLERLGGIDFDAAILNHVDQAVDGQVHALDAANPEARAALGRLRDECRSAKEALSSDTEAEIPVLLPDVRSNVRITRAEFEGMVRPRLEDTFPVLDRVVASAGIAMGDVAVVLMIGGGARIPVVGQLLRERTGRPVAVDANPKGSVAIGAAHLAAGTGGLGAAGAGVAAAAAAGAASPAAASTPAATTEARPRKRRRVLVPVLVALALAAAAGGAAVALTAKSDSKGDAVATGKNNSEKKKGATTSTSTATTTSTTPTATTGAPVAQKKTTPTTKATTTTTQPAPPTISASNASGAIHCNPPDPRTATIQWSAANTTTVTLYSNIATVSNLGPSGTQTIQFQCTMTGGGSENIQVKAVGPGGEIFIAVAVPYSKF